jgi:hypothetical protein
MRRHTPLWVLEGEDDAPELKIILRCFECGDTLVVRRIDRVSGSFEIMTPEDTTAWVRHAGTDWVEHNWFVEHQN